MTMPTVEAAPLIVNTKRIPRPRWELMRPFFALVELMAARGWTLSLRMPHKNSPGWVSFEKTQDWHGLALLNGNYRFGYHFNDINQGVITQTAQRSAELCLTVYETFTMCRPSNPNVYGDIKPDPFTLKPPYNTLTQAELDVRHADLAMCHFYDPIARHIIFNRHLHQMRFEQVRIPHYLACINTLEQTLSGRYATVL